MDLDRFDLIIKAFDGSRNSSPAVAGLPSGSANRWYLAPILRALGEILAHSFGLDGFTLVEWPELGWLAWVWDMWFTMLAKGFC